jgi:hypothetical protein
MKITSILLVLALVMLLASPAGFRIATEMAILILGTALPIQAAIYSIRGFRPLRPLRTALVGGFDRLPVALGFGLLVLLGASAIALLMFMLRDHVPPSDSWVPITLGFILGVMGPVFRSLNAGKSNREQGAPSNGGQRSSWNSAFLSRRG